MSNSRQFPSFCNFMMLTNKLHALFVKYIIDGRSRAPPITDLVDLISSFQFGARTDRRALQSKFKSWARRMTVADGRLKLASSYKEIIPLEKCDDLVMCLHSDGHKSVDQVISKIREKYTWTKKNFGMDSFMVMNYILRNCSNLDCRRQIEIEISRRHCCDNFIKNVILSSESQTGIFTNLEQERFPIMNNSFFNNCSSLYPWPFVFPLTANSIPNELCSTYNVIKTEVDVTTPVSNENKPRFPTLNPKCLENSICYQSPKTEAKTTNFQIQEPYRLRKKRFSKPSGTFRKPKTISEFKALLIAAEQLTEAYPSILRDPKTTFLGGLDLAPKKICSKRTLMKFEKEKRRKRILEKQHLLYHKNRKNLRDRNKLNKIKLKQEQEKRAYLDVSVPQKKVSPSKQGIVIANSSNTCREKTIDDCDIEIVKVIPSKHEPEVILITSSDDEFANDKVKMKSNNFKNIKVAEGDSKGQVSISKKIERSEKDVEIVFNKENSSRNDTNVPRLSSHYTQHPVLRKAFLPPNIKGEIAVLPFSKYPSLKPLNQVHPSGNQDCNMKTSIKGKDSFLQPFSIKNIAKKPVFFNKPSTGLHLPESKIFLFKKTEKGDMKMACRKQIRVPSPQLPSQSNKNASIPVDVVINENTSSLSTVQKEKERIISVQKTDARTSQNFSSDNRSIHEEMSKLSKWIRKTKMTMVKTFFNHEVVISTRKLESQLDAGITLIRSIRRKLLEVERIDIKINTEAA